MFNKWKFIFYSKLAQLSRNHNLIFNISLNKIFPKLYDIKNAYLRNHIRLIKKEIYILSNINLFVWNTITNIFFNIFFYKKTKLINIILIIVLLLMSILLLSIIFYVFLIKLHITYTNKLTDILPLFLISSQKFIFNIFYYLLLIGL